MADFNDVVGVLRRFALLYPNFQPEDAEETAQAWLEMVSHIESGQFLAGALAAAGEPNRRFAPSVGEVLGKITELQAQAAKIPSAVQAWAQINVRPHWQVVRCAEAQGLMAAYNKPGAKVRQVMMAYDTHLKNCAICSEGVIEPVVHPLAAQVARQLGWPERFPGENTEADRAHFMRAYENALRSALQQEAQIPAVRAVYERVGQLAEGMRG